MRKLSMTLAALAALVVPAYAGADGDTMYVTGNDEIRVVDLESETVIDTIAAPASFMRPAITRDRSEVWITNSSGPVNILDTETNTVIDTVGPPGVAIGMHSGGTVYLADSDSSTPDDGVAVIDVGTRVVMTTITIAEEVSPSNFDLTMSPDNQRVYVVNQATDALHEINTVTNTQIGDGLPVPGFGPAVVAVSPDGQRVYVGFITDVPPNFLSDVLVVDTSDLTVVDTFSIGASFIQSMALRGDGQVLYVVDGNPDGTVYVVDANDGSIITSVSAGVGARKAVVDNTRGILYVATSAGLVKVDIATNANLGTIAMSSPFDMVIRRGDAIFSDGFESGNTSGWSATVQ